MKCLHETFDDILTPLMGNEMALESHIDVSFVVNPDCHSQRGITGRLKGGVINGSEKQKPDSNS